MSSIGFTSHAPVPFKTDWTMDPKDLPGYLAEINRLKAEYRGKIEIYLGLEVDYLPEFPEARLDRFTGLDYVIGSIHYMRADNSATLTAKARLSSASAIPGSGQKVISQGGTSRP